MQLYEAGTLEDRQNQERYREPRLAMELMLKIAAGVQYAHSHGVLHCDLKPSNILFDTDAAPRVSDFGLAARWQASASRRSLRSCQEQPAGNHLNRLPAKRAAPPPMSSS